MLTTNELGFTFGGSYVCADYGENRSRNAIVRVCTDGYTDTLTDANRFYNLSHAICYSYGTDNERWTLLYETVACCSTTRCAQQTKRIKRC